MPPGRLATSAKPALCRIAVACAERLPARQWAAVILADPIFKGLAISLIAGEIASLLISRMAVPVLYYMANKKLRS